MDHSISILELARWVIGVGASLFGLFCAAGNWITLINVIVTKGSTSFIHFIGGILLTIGLLILPIEGLWKWAWIGLLIDFGTAPIWIWIGIQTLFFGPPKTKKSNAA